MSTSHHVDGRSRLFPVTGGPATMTASAQGIGHIAARLLGIRPGTSTPGQLTIVVEDDCERWIRSFGTGTWTSTVRRHPTDGTVLERIGPFTLRFDVVRDAVAIGDTVMSLREVRIGRRRVPVRRAFDIAGRIGADGATTIVIELPAGSLTYAVEFGGRS